MARQYGNNTAASANARAQVAEEVRQKATITHAVEWAIAGVLLLIGIIVLISGLVSSNTGSEQLLELQAEIDSQKLIMEQKKIDIDNNVTKLETVTNSASEPGLRLCELQNLLNAEIKNGSNRYKIGDLTNGSMSDDYILTPMTLAHKQYIEELRKILGTSSAEYRMSGLLKTWCPYGAWSFKGTYTYGSDEQRLYSFACYAVNPDGTIDHDRLLTIVTMKYHPSDKKFRDGAQFYTKYYYEEQAKMPLIALEDETIEDVIDRIEDPDAIAPDISMDDESNDNNDSEANNVIPPVSSLDGATLPDDSTDNSDGNTDNNPDDSNPDNNPGDNDNNGSSGTVTTPPATTQPVVTTPAELEYFYSWSSKYGEWGYFDSNGVFYTIEEYEAIMR